MESPDIKINVPKGSEVEQESSQNQPDKTVNSNAEATDYLVEGVSGGNEVLQKIKEIKEQEPDDFIYGVTDRNMGFLDRVNNFFIDRSRVRLKEKSYFFHMLAVMVDAGIPVVGAVASLAGRSENKRFARVLRTIAYNCEGGAKLSDAMSRFDEIFDEAEVGIVRSGEATGRLHKMLFKLSEQLDKKHDLSMKLWGAAVYPIVVFFVLIIVAVGMLVWVFPTLLRLLQEGGVSDDALPLATKVLIFIQTGITGYWWAILLFAFAVYGVFAVYVQTDFGAVRWAKTKLKIPLVGKLLRKLSVLRFVSLLGLLIESGLPVIRAIKIAGSSIKNKIYKLKVQEILDDVKTGGKISESMRDSEFLFPIEVSQMIAVGENSASLGKISEKISDQYDREIDNTLKKISSVFEPLMILFVGVFVALLALAIMAPIFNLSSVIGG